MYDIGLTQIVVVSQICDNGPVRDIYIHIYVCVYYIYTYIYSYWTLAAF